MNKPTRPPISWDLWPADDVVRAVFVLILPTTPGQLHNPVRRDRDIQLKRIQAIGAFRTYTNRKYSWPETARIFGVYHHSAIHYQYQRWLLLPRTEREKWLFQVLVQMHANHKIAGPRPLGPRYTHPLDGTPGRGQGDRPKILQAGRSPPKPFRKVCAY